MRNIIIIPARMASKRFPGKPLAKIKGIPMIQRVWQQAIDSDVGEVFVACSEKEVFDLITNLGGNAILTDPNLPSGTDRIYAAYKQIKNPGKNIINLQGDMPLIHSSHIQKVLEPIKNNFKIGTLATNLKKSQLQNPNITKIEIDWKNKNIGNAKNFFRIKKSLSKNKTYHHVGIYSFTSESLSEFVKLPKSKNEISLNLEQYRAMDAKIKIGVVYIPGIPLSIDTKEDLINTENIIRGLDEKN